MLLVTRGHPPPPGGAHPVPAFFVQRRARSVVPGCLRVLTLGSPPLHRARRGQVQRAVASFCMLVLGALIKSDLSLNLLDAAMSFHVQVLVACGIIYRGINLPDVAQVISYDTPLSLAEYARRLGRAGREGRQGTGTTLVTPSDGAAVAPLVAVLRAGRQLVPDWLLAIAEGAGDIVAGDAATDGGEGAEDCSTSGSASEQARLMQPEALADARTVTSGVDSVATEARTAGDGRQKSSSRRQQDQSSHGSGGATFSVRSRRNHKAHFGSYMYDDELDVT